MRILGLVTRSLGSFYAWLYFRCYRHSLKADGKSSMNWANASLYVVMILLMNIVVLLFAFGFLFKTNFGIPIGLPHWTIALTFIAILLSHHVYLRHGGRYEDIIREFSKESAERRRRGDLLFFWYVALSLLAFIATGVITAAVVGLK